MLGEAFRVSDGTEALQEADQKSSEKLFGIIEKRIDKARRDISGGYSEADKQGSERRFEKLSRGASGGRSKKLGVAF